MTYRIHLDNFEGPLDLLLYFIKRDELDIYDIPIAKITKDFVDVIEQWKKLNLMIAGEFIVMASTLMRVKARLMIPRQEIDEDGEVIDPRLELMQQLIDYKRFHDAADMLDNLANNRKGYIQRQITQDISHSDIEDLSIYIKDVTLYDLARVFKETMDARPVISQFELNREPVKLEKQKELILKYFDGEGKLNFSSLINTLNSKMEIIVTFLAVLDLIREGICSIKQSKIFSNIELIQLGIKS